MYLNSPAKARVASFGILCAVILPALEHSAVSRNLSQEDKKETYQKGSCFVLFFVILQKALASTWTQRSVCCILALYQAHPGKKVSYTQICFHSLQLICSLSHHKIQTTFQVLRHCGTTFSPVFFLLTNEFPFGKLHELVGINSNVQFGKMLRTVKIST